MLKHSLFILTIMLSTSLFAKDSLNLQFKKFAEVSGNFGVSNLIYSSDFFKEAFDYKPGFSYGILAKYGFSISKKIQLSFGLGLNVFHYNHYKEDVWFPDGTRIDWSKLNYSERLIYFPISVFFQPIKKLPISVGIGITGSYVFSEKVKLRTSDSSLNEENTNTASLQDFAFNASIFYVKKIDRLHQLTFGFDFYKSIYMMEAWKDGNFEGDLINFAATIGIRRQF